MDYFVFGNWRVCARRFSPSLPLFSELSGVTSTTATQPYTALILFFWSFISSLGIDIIILNNTVNTAIREGLMLSVVVKVGA
jgi:hypothetical protein